MEKSFDRVWCIVPLESFRIFWFLPKVYDCIKVLYSGVESILKINGGLCAPFKVYKVVSGKVLIIWHALFFSD